MKRHIASQLAAILVAVGFGLFVLQGALTGSDFPRGLYGPPIPAKWDSIALLNANRIWNYNFNHETSLQNYLNNASNYGMKAVLTLDTTDCDTFYLNYYSCGQHHIYQAEWDYSGSSYWINNDRPEYFYYFYHWYTGVENVRGQLDTVGNVPAWKCTQGVDSQGWMLTGPNETLTGPNHTGTHGNQDRSPTQDDDSFKVIIRVMANLDSLSALTDTVFRFQVLKNSPETTLLEEYYTGQSFADTSYPNWKHFEKIYQIPDGAFAVFYRMYWKGLCNFWVDQIEFYDMRRGRYLFTDQTTRNTALTLIANQCQAIENDPNKVNKMAGWKQPDEPLRSMYDAVGVVNLMARDSLTLPLQMPYSQLQLHCWYTQRPELFALLGRPAANYPAH